LNSPPIYFTKNGRANSDDWSNFGPSNLKEDSYDDFAEFMSTVVKHFIDLGYNFNAISPVNEP
jgi:O-glycosyl hydrolase